MKNKALANIESRMADLEPGSIRYEALKAARDFKSSWIDLGRHLFAVQQDKLFRQWGYLTFEAYCSREVGIRQTTAVKLLRSYSFLEREEPAFLKDDAFTERKPAHIPSYESVNVLRLAKSDSRIPEEEYETLRQDVLENAKEGTEVRKKIRYLLKAQGSAEEPEEETRRRRAAAFRRLESALQSARSQAAELGIPKPVLRKVEELLDVLAGHLEDKGR